MGLLNRLFEDDSQYFSQAIEFFTRFEWLFKYRNTHIHDILKNIPDEWIAILNLYQPLHIRKARSGEFYVKKTYNFNKVLVFLLSVMLNGRSAKVLS